jgi:hypothetical protein
MRDGESRGDDPALFRGEVLASGREFRARARGIGHSDEPAVIVSRLGGVADAIDGRHQNWAKQLPQEPGDLWDVLVGFDRDSQAALFAHCASLTVSAVHEQWNRNPHRIAHADRVARTVGLDMAAVGWTPTVDNYLGRVTKARILEAIREAKGDASAQLIDHLKKPDMAKEAERLLADTGWLPSRYARRLRRFERRRPSLAMASRASRLFLPMKPTSPLRARPTASPPK